ncbi:MAG: hypothetical protein NTZ19_00860 [Bacteroidetes bacterium]|nr:hypothetical protein [Bacteroidota bacterium]
MNYSKKLGIYLITLFVCGLTSPVFSQTLKDVFSNSNCQIIYLGIDFTKTKLLDKGNVVDIRDHLYGNINQLIVNEPKKYDLKGALLKNNIDYDFGPVTKSNARIDLNEILSNNSMDFNRLKEADITAVVNNLEISEKTGIGLLFVMEGMRKTGNSGESAVWVTFIDLKNKSVLMTDRVIGKGSFGIGFRNFWASTIKDLIDEIKHRKYKDWQIKYAK